MRTPTTFRNHARLLIGFLICGTGLAIIATDVLTARGPGEEVYVTTAGDSAGSSAPAADTKGGIDRAMELDAVRDILSVRRTQGDLFKGTVFEESRSAAGNPQCESELEFTQVLQDVVRRQHQDNALPTTADTASTTACDSAYRQLIAQENPAVAVDQPLVDGLRHAARLLDEKAEGLDEACEYRRADRLRAIADTLRREARHCATPRIPAPDNHRANRNGPVSR